MAMVRVYSLPTLDLVQEAMTVLNNHGIASAIGGDRLYADDAADPHAPWVDLWVEDTDAASAAALLHAIDAPSADADPWPCPQCDASIEAEFGVCWNCGEPRPTADAPETP